MLKDESGSLTTAAAIFIPGLMLGAAMVVDFLLLNAHRSHLQAQADMAALEAVRFVSDEKRAYAQAVTSVALNDRFEARALRRQDMDLGRVEAGLFVPQSLHASNPNAARVVVPGIAVSINKVKPPGQALWFEHGHGGFPFQICSFNCAGIPPLTRQG